MGVASKTGIGLDHIGLFSSTIGSVSAQYERLGFLLTPLSQHARPMAPGMPAVLRGTGNRCVMLRHGYIELLAVIDASLDTLGVPEAIERYAGLHILAFGIDDPDLMQLRLKAAGFDVTQTLLERMVDTPDGSGLARFIQVRTPETSMPEGRVFMLRHETPELVWQERYLSHPNTAIGLAEIVVAVDDLHEAQGRYDRYFGCPAQHSPGQISYELSGGLFTLMDAAAITHSYPQVILSCLPFPAVFVVDVQSLETVAHHLAVNSVPYSRDSTGVTVAAEFAGGAVIVFSEAGRHESV